jgi:hypothetical protein
MSVPDTVSFETLLTHICSISLRDRTDEDVRYIIHLSQELVRLAAEDRAIDKHQIWKRSP